MATVGEQLRAVREKKKLTLADVAERTKAREDHVRAFEEGNFAAFPAPIYIRGFARSYAAMLNLNIPPIIEALNLELAGTGHAGQEPRFSLPSKNFLDVVMLRLSRIHWRIALPVMLLLIIGGGSLWAYRHWQTQKNRDPLQEIGPGLHTPKIESSLDYLPLPQQTNVPLKRP